MGGGMGRFRWPLKKFLKREKKKKVFCEGQKPSTPRWEKKKKPITLRSQRYLTREQKKNNPCKGQKEKTKLADFFFFFFLKKMFLETWVRGTWLIAFIFLFF
jgi:hypothetical protein